MSGHLSCATCRVAVIDSAISFIRWPINRRIPCFVALSSTGGGEVVLEVEVDRVPTKVCNRRLSSDVDIREYRHWPEESRVALDRDGARIDVDRIEIGISSYRPC